MRHLPRWKLLVIASMLLLISLPELLDLIFLGTTKAWLGLLGTGLMAIGFWLMHWDAGRRR